MDTKRATYNLLLFTVFSLALFNQSFARLNTEFYAHYDKILNKYPSISTKLLLAGLNAYKHANEKHLQQKHILTLVDYSKPSNEKRLWVFDLKRDKLLYKDFVAHGSGSGARFATHFSNKPGSHESSYGVYLTEQPYIGSHGLSLRLKGLEKGINDKAESRAIVIHSAWYANAQFAKKYGRIGRSWGCFAVNPKLIKPLIQTIKNGSLLVAYYPNYYWLHHSAYVA